MKIFKQLIAVGLLIGLACGSAWAAKEVSLVNGEVKLVTGFAPSNSSNTWSINGKLIDGPTVCFGSNDWATWDIRGYDYFKGTIGILDNCDGEKGSLTFEVDGDLVKRASQQHRQNATEITIPLTNKASLTIRGDGNTVQVINPVLIKGSPAPAAPSTSSSTSATSTDATPASNNSAPFVVEPRDLETLAQKLWESVSAKPELKKKVENSNIAITTFELVDIPSVSVAKNVADDLYTALIKSGFSPVERGQLDKLLKELSIQSSGMIDPKTAQKIGQVCGCELVLLGSISDRGQFVVVNARLMETSTGRAVAAERVDMRKVSIAR